MNPFAALQVSDDEDQQFVQAKGTEPKPVKKTHQQRKQAKEAKIKQAETGTKQSVVVEQVLPERVKEDPRKKRYHEVVPPKELPATGHYLDRRSGTGRVDRPRKQGGGRGGIGNLHDELQKEKYIKEGEQTKPAEGENTTEEAKEPEKPQGITLDEYFRNKGIEVDLTAANKRQPVKKGEVNADWIKKEKLTVLQTKEDKKANQDNEKGGKRGRRQYNDKVGLADNLNSELFGFNAQVPKPVERQQRQQRQPRQQRQQRQPRQPREQRQPREHRQPRQPRQNRQHKEPRQPREQRQPREHREQRQPRENNRQHKGNQNGNGGQRGGNKGAPRPQQKVVININDFPTL